MTSFKAQQAPSHLVLYITAELCLSVGQQDAITINKARSWCTQQVNSKEPWQRPST